MKTREENNSIPPPNFREKMGKTSKSENDSNPPPPTPETSKEDGLKERISPIEIEIQKIVRKLVN